MMNLDYGVRAVIGWSGSTKTSIFYLNPLNGAIYSKIDYLTTDSRGLIAVLFVNFPDLHRLNLVTQSASKFLAGFENWHGVSSGI